ncbi:succinate dehydrogenase, cytochrome b556 subunit [Alteraurantiacibacter aquimixticola]|uniref:Succinate dehydrogenase cytochrome b556 subunit n=1 Tax=Alteraurantiacibacter aquimixticola TaxID=2489173 RepID=A0A4T3F5W7_9SPHN|nr:succinate dehydrogenase, cytochrome b556 subunit [Alteraurantiacibacter aquimixticola]TIX50246.1 succinate dehydrogenase, cytochrome b556 subunit [Alteraurantiacibacter aquimixticola]
MADRPLSPHLQIWKWGPHMLVSILHRVTGDGMALVGLPVMLWWLGSLASGPEAYAAFQGHAMSWYGLIVMFGLSWAFFNHLCSGLRHFVLDMGAGFELNSNRNWSVGSIACALILTVAFWAAMIAL